MSFIIATLVKFERAQLQLATGLLDIIVMLWKWVSYNSSSCGGKSAPVIWCFHGLILNFYLSSCRVCY